MSTNYRDRIAASKSKLRSTAEPIAAALALAALAGSAQAVTIYTVANPLPHGYNGGFAFDPFTGAYSQDAQNQGSNPIWVAFCGGFVNYQTGNVSFYKGDLASFPERASSGTGVTYLAPAGTLLNDSTSFGATNAYTSNETFGSDLSYLAYKIDQGGATHYGWVELSKEGPLVTAFRFALGEDGEEVTVGSATSPVPEASTSLGLLALCAGGLTMRLRLKRAD
jgi:hypothetical protein